MSTSTESYSTVRCNFWSWLEILAASIKTAQPTDPRRNSLRQDSSSPDAVLRHHLRPFLQLLHHLRHEALVNQTLLNPVLGEIPRESDPRCAARFSSCSRSRSLRQSRSVHQTSQNCALEGVAVALVPVRPPSPPRRHARTAPAVRAQRLGTTTPRSGSWAPCSAQSHSTPRLNGLPSELKPLSSAALESLESQLFVVLSLF